MQIFMLMRQLDVFDPLKIRKLRANSNSNSKLELDDFEPSWSHLALPALLASTACPRAVDNWTRILPLANPFDDLDEKEFK